MAMSSMNFMRGTKKLVGRCRMSYAAAVAEVDEGLLSSEVEYCCEEVKARKTTRETKNIEECEWVPHPRSGIYFPKGHDWVLEDVPHSVAASSAPTFWIRNVDGVDRPHDYF